MQVPLQIAFHNLNRSEAVTELIEEKVAWLERFYNRITSCRVVVEEPHRHHRQGNSYVVRIELSVPGSQIVINREMEKDSEIQDPEGAIREAFEVARRRLEEFGRQQKELKNHQPHPVARIHKLFLEQGYGFLLTSDDREIYFHKNAVLNGGIENLQIGTTVTFVEEEGLKGPQASTVRVMSHPKNV